MLSLSQDIEATTSSNSRLHRATQELLSKASIQINRGRPWNMKLMALGVFERAFSKDNLGLGETYMDGARLLATKLADQVQPLRMLGHVIAARLLNRQHIQGAKQVGKVHYDLGNDFYAPMLDSRMTYTCGYSANANSLEEAQEAKLDLICRKLKLQPGVLDIGCGWGSFMAHAAEKYGVQCVGISISKEQVNWAQQRYASLPLEFRLQDYRELNEPFDAIASVRMFEHVGRKNYRKYMEVAHKCLNPGGLFLLQTIGKNMRKSAPDPWIGKYIFPNGDLPSIGQTGDALDNLFVVEDLHNFGSDYDKTLMAWFARFDAAWPKFEKVLGPRFYRM